MDLIQTNTTKVGVVFCVALSVTTLALGVQLKGNCPASENIPIYMIGRVNIKQNHQTLRKKLLKFIFNQDLNNIFFRTWLRVPLFDDDCYVLLVLQICHWTHGRHFLELPLPFCHCLLCYPQSQFHDFWQCCSFWCRGDRPGQQHLQLRALHLCLHLLNHA